MVNELLKRVDFDPTLHSRARLKIAMVLAASPNATFNGIAKLTGLTPGNLATHMKALVASGYVRSQMRLVGLKPRVRYQLTCEGRDALQRYCDAVSAAMARLKEIVAQPPPQPSLDSV